MCPNCLPKVQKRFRKLAVPIVKVGEDGTIIPPKQTDKQTNALLTKIGTSMYRGQNLDIAVGTRNKRLILASDMIDSDQRGDDALDCEFSENAQDRAEAGDVPWGAELDAEILVEDEGAEAEPELDPEQVMEPANVPAELELTEELWLSGPDAIETERQLKLINWFLTSPPGHVHRRTGLHPMTIARMKTSLRTLCPELVAKAVATGTSQIIAEALLQQRNLRDLKADNDL